VQITGASAGIPTGCPGSSSPSTAAAPNTCTFGSSYAGTTWVLNPGYYPGGISLLAGTYFLRPGVYYLAGGGFNFNSNNSGLNVYTISATWSSTSPPTSCTIQSFADCGGALFYNTNDPFCTSSCGSSAATLQPVKLAGNGPVVQLYPIQNAGPYTNILVFQDRALAPVGGSTGDVSINASSSVTIVGAMYVPRGLVSLAGGGDLGTVQMIANQLSVNGTGTAIHDFFSSGAFPQLHAVGLVE